MKKFVCKREDGSLYFVSTPGFKPAGYLCEAREDWVLDEISEANGVVFIDPSKVKLKEAIRIREKWEIQKKDRLLKVKFYLRTYGPVILAFLMGVMLSELARLL